MMFYVLRLLSFFIKVISFGIIDAVSVHEALSPAPFLDLPNFGEFVSWVFFLPALSQRASAPPPGGAAPSPRTSSSAPAPAASSAPAPVVVAVTRSMSQIFGCVHPVLKTWMWWVIHIHSSVNKNTEATSSSRRRCSFCSSIRFCLSASSWRLCSSFCCCSSCWRRISSERSLLASWRRRKSRLRVDSPGMLMMELKWADRKKVRSWFGSDRPV